MSKLSNRFFFLIFAYFLCFGMGNRLYSWHLFLNNKIILKSPVQKVMELGGVIGEDLNPETKKNIKQTVISLKLYKNRTLSKNEIKEILNNSGLYPESIRGDSLIIEVPMITVSKSDIEKSIINGLNIDDSIYQVKVNDDLSVPSFLKYKIKVGFSRYPGEKIGYLTFNEPGVNDLEFNYKLLQRVVAFRAIKDIKAGERIVQNQLEKKIFFTESPEKFNRDLNPVGYEVIKDIRTGDIIENSNIKKVIDVKPGDTIYLIYSGKNLKISIKTTALQYGSIGQSIRLRYNKRYLKGELVSSKEALFER